jgi:hypothetical protein
MADQYTAVAPRFNRDQIERKVYRILVIEAFQGMEKYLPSEGELSESVQASMVEGLTEAGVEHYVHQGVLSGAPAIMQVPGSKEKVKVYSSEFVHLYATKPVLPSAGGAASKPKNDAQRYALIASTLRQAEKDGLSVDKTREAFKVAATTADFKEMVMDAMWADMEDRVIQNRAEQAAKAQAKVAEAAAALQAAIAEGETEGTEPVAEPEDVDHTAALEAAGLDLDEDQDAEDEDGEDLE